MSEEKASLPGSTSPPPTAPAPPQVAAPVPAAAPAMGAPAFTPTPQPPPYLAPAPVMVPRVGVITPMHQPAIMGVTTVPHAPVVMVNPLMAASSIYGPQPIHTKCQFCEATVLTRITQNMSGQGWILVVVLILIFPCAACVPCCVDSFYDTDHYCPNCNRLVGQYRGR